MPNSDLHFLGYRRPDGTFGVRNHVAVIGAMDNSNPVVRRIVSMVRGTVALDPSFGRGLVGDDLEQHARTLVGMGAGPNVAAAVVVSLEAVSANRVAERIAKTGRPVHTIILDRIGGTVKAVEDGIRAATQMVVDASSLQREPVPLSELVLGVECGGSDTSSGVASNPATGNVADRVVAAGGTAIMSEPVEWMGGEHLLAARAVNREVADEILRIVKWYDDYALSIGVDLIGTNPAPDNIAGGLTTIEEKALGAIKKGGTTPVTEALGYAFRPTKKGLVVMDAPPPGTENITGLAGGGCHIIIFSTGRGNPIGNPVVPTIKVTGNPHTVALAGDNIDFEVTRVLAGEESVAEAGNRLFAHMLDVANGKLTRAEVLGDVEVSITRIGFSL